MSTTAAAKPLQNIYYERKVATERPCYICKRPTAIVLATIDIKDYVYTCESHLSDRGFATLLTPPAAPTPPGPSQEDIRKVIADYKAREEKKGEKAKEKEKETTNDDTREPPLTNSASPKPPSTPVSPPPAATPTPTHRKYALHRQIFDMRVQEIKRKEQGVKAREVGKG